MLYRAEPDREQMAANGLTMADFEADYTAHIWPDNVMPVDVFVAMGTQWRVAFGGCTGLDYGALPEVMRMCGVKRSDWSRVFADVRVMEQAALEQMDKDRK